MKRGPVKRLAARRVPDNFRRGGVVPSRIVRFIVVTPRFERSGVGLVEAPPGPATDSLPV